MTAAELLALAASLPASTVDKLAHALGWPSNYALARGAKARRVKWANPYRNHYAGSDADEDWRRALGYGLAARAGRPTDGYPYTSWTVTDLGRAVIRVRLQAARLAYDVSARRRAP